MREAERQPSGRGGTTRGFEIFVPHVSVPPIRVERMLTDAPGACLTGDDGGQLDAGGRASRPARQACVHDEDGGRL